MLELNINELLELTTDERQLRLFAVACCRNILHLLTDQRSRQAVEIAESFADGLASEEELSVARAAAWYAVNAAENSAWAAWTDESSAMDAAWAAENVAESHARHAAKNAVWYAAWAESYTERHAERKQQLVFLKDIINQPSIELNPNLLYWNNTLLPKFATNIYTNKDFGLMSILADALEDANAPNFFIEHARMEVHVKGCWLLDVLMGKR